MLATDLQFRKTVIVLFYNCDLAWVPVVARSKVQGEGKRGQTMNTDWLLLIFLLVSLMATYPAEAVTAAVAIRR
jgi:hypothetical protein